MFNRNNTRLIGGIVMITLIFCGLQATAASLRDRMVARIPAITSLKDKGVIGENNKGYLQYLGKDQPDKKTVQAENSDRKSVYDAIARKGGADIDFVGKRRAKQIAEKGSPGHWFQNADGKWYKK